MFSNVYELPFLWSLILHFILFNSSSLSRCQPFVPFFFSSCYNFEFCHTSCVCRCMAYRRVPARAQMSFKHLLLGRHVILIKITWILFLSHRHVSIWRAFSWGDQLWRLEIVYCGIFSFSLSRKGKKKKKGEGGFV